MTDETALLAIPEGQCHMKDCAAPSAYYVRARCASFDEARDSHDDGMKSIPFCAICAAAVHAHGVPVYPLLAVHASSLNA